MRRTRLDECDFFLHFPLELGLLSNTGSKSEVAEIKVLSVLLFDIDRKYHLFYYYTCICLGRTEYCLRFF